MKSAHEPTGDGKYTDERAKGFKQGGIPEKQPFQFHGTEAEESTPADRETNTMKEDKS